MHCKQDGYTSSSNFIDYITIVKQNQEAKLNINKLITKQSIENIGENQGIEIAVNSRAIYMDYEKYNITVKNNTDNTILLNDGKTQSNICIIDGSNNEFNSLIYEVPRNNLSIMPKYQRTIDIKFNKMYNANSTINYMQIKDIYLNKDEYESGNLNGAQKISMQIKL